MKQLIIFSSLILFYAPAFAAEWNCRNHDMEITCDSTKCSSSDGFTPFSININDKGKLDICAYAGCWSGRGAVLARGSHVLISAQNMKWSGKPATKASFIVALDKADRVGILKGEGFAMPFTCPK